MVCVIINGKDFVISLYLFIYLFIYLAHFMLFIYLFSFHLIYLAYLFIYLFIYLFQNGRCYLPVFLTCQASVVRNWDFTSIIKNFLSRALQMYCKYGISVSSYQYRRHSITLNFAQAHQAHSIELKSRYQWSSRRRINTRKIYLHKEGTVPDKLRSGLSQVNWYRQIESQ